MCIYLLWKIYFRDGRSLANLMKSSLGSGILAMPLAFKNAGIIPGIFGTIIIGFICTHCSKILVSVYTLSIRYISFENSIIEKNITRTF